MYIFSLAKLKFVNDQNKSHTKKKLLERAHKRIVNVQIKNYEKLSLCREK